MIKIKFINSALVKCKLIILRKYNHPTKSFITEKDKQKIINNPQRYSNLPVRVRMGKFYTDNELKKYKEKSLKRKLP